MHVAETRRSFLILFVTFSLLLFLKLLLCSFHCCRILCAECFNFCFFNLLFLQPSVSFFVVAAAYHIYIYVYDVASSDDQLSSLDLVADSEEQADTLVGLLSRLVVQCADERTVRRGQGHHGGVCDMHEMYAGFFKAWLKRWSVVLGR